MNNIAIILFKYVKIIMNPVSQLSIAEQKALGTHISALRLKKGLSLEEVARRHEIDSVALMFFERGISFDSEIAKKLTEVFQVTLPLPTPREIFTKNLCFLRQRTKAAYSDIAEKIHSSTSAVWYHEKGKKYNEETVEKIAGFFNITFKEITTSDLTITHPQQIAKFDCVSTAKEKVEERRRRNQKLGPIFKENFRFLQKHSGTSVTTLAEEIDVPVPTVANHYTWFRFNLEVATKIAEFYKHTFDEITSPDFIKKYKVPEGEVERKETLTKEEIDKRKAIVKVNLKYNRVAEKLSLRQLAEKIGSSHIHVLKHEQGKTYNPTTVAKLAKHFKVPFKLFVSTVL